MYGDIKKGLNKIAKVARESEEIINEIITEKFKNVLSKEENNKIYLDYDKLKKENDAILKKIIIHSIKRLENSFIDISEKNILEALDILKKGINRKEKLLKKEIKVAIIKENNKKYFVILKK